MRKNLFKELLKSLERDHNSIEDEYKYIGTGNPFSDILIIGKEAAISIKEEQYKNEIIDNYNFWTNNKKFDTEQLKEKSENYNPLYPYKGQLLKKNNRNGNWGTSTTWMNYQKLYNYIFEIENNNKINFHEKIFITEVNSTPSKKTKNADTSSINFRKKYIFESKYFNKFSIIIISGIGYFDIAKNEIEEIFKVKYRELRYAGNKKNQPYWLHWNDEKTKLVINTYQLSIGIADVLLREIAKEIKNSKLLNN